MGIMKKFYEDKRGISVMHDAILFCLLISFSGIILFSPLMENMLSETYIQKEEEEKADEILYQFMTCSVDEFEYLNADSILKSIGINTSQNLIKSILDNLMKREQLHSTYANLCAECLACQFNFFGYRINILTQNFTDMLKILLKKFLDERTGSIYDYNLSVIWNPISGLDIGGYLYVGKPLPENHDVYTSSSYLTMPPTFLTQTNFSVNNIKEYILNSGLKENFSELKNNSISNESFKKFFKKILIELFNKTIWKGFDYNEDGDFNDEYEMRSLIDVLIDHLFNKINSGIEYIFDESISIVNNIVAESLDKKFNLSLQYAIQNSLSSFIGEYEDNFIYNLTYNARKYVKEKSKEFIERVIYERIDFLVEDVIERMNVESIEKDFFNWFLKNFNFWRAKVSIAIWRE